MAKFLIIIIGLASIGLIQFTKPTKPNYSVQKTNDSIQTILTDTPCIPKIDTLDGQKVHRKAEKVCEFPGGQGEFSRYLQKNLRYPANQDDWQDRVRITFVVDTFGSLRNLCVINNSDPNYLSPFDSSVINMFQKMPKWTPAEIGGEKVIYRHIASINVHLQ